MDRDYGELNRIPRLAAGGCNWLFEGKKVMQFLRNGRYLAVVVDRQGFTYDSGSVGSL